MKKVKIVLPGVIGLILGFCIAANAAIVTTYTYGDGTTEWTNTTAAVGDWSLQLNDPGNTINYAGILIDELGDPKVKDFTGWSYWTNGPEFHGVNVRMWLDTSYDNYPGEDWDVALNVMPYNMMGDDTIPGNTWVQIESTNPYPYQFFAWDSDGIYLGGHDISMWPDGTTWNEFQTMDPVYADVDWGDWGYTYDFSEAVIKKISFRMGGGGHVDDFVGYLDDFTFDGLPVVVENGFTIIPEPGTVIVWGLLGLAVVGYGAWRRRRG